MRTGWVVVGTFLLACAEKEAPADDDLRAARALFDRSVVLGEQDYLALAELYADSAQIRFTRNMAAGGVEELLLSGAQWKRNLVSLARAKDKDSGPSSWFSHVSVHREAKGVRIAALQHVPQKCRVDELYSMVVAPNAQGVWQIIAKSSQMWELSACGDVKPPKPLAEELRELADSFSSTVPLEIDSSTRLDSVALDGTRLVYRYTRHGRRAWLAPVHTHNPPDGCSTTRIGDIVRRGATVVSEYADVRGRLLERIVLDRCAEP